MLFWGVCGTLSFFVTVFFSNTCFEFPGLSALASPAALSLLNVPCRDRILHVCL